MHTGIAGLLTLAMVAGCGNARAEDSGQRRTGPGTVTLRFDKEAPAVGERVPDVTLVDTKGLPRNLRDLCGEHYTVLVLGCLT